MRYACFRTQNPGTIVVEAKKLETQSPQSLREVHRECQHYLSLSGFQLFGFTIRIQGGVGRGTPERRLLSRFPRRNNIGFGAEYPSQKKVKLLF